MLSRLSFVTQGSSLSLQGEILCFNKCTLETGGELDYAVVSKRFRPYCTCELEHSVPWRPHYAFKIFVQQGLEQECYPTLTCHRPIDISHGPVLPWEEYHVDTNQVRVTWRGMMTAIRNSSKVTQPGPNKRRLKVSPG